MMELVHFRCDTATTTPASPEIKRPRLSPGPRYQKEGTPQTGAIFNTTASAARLAADLDLQVAMPLAVPWHLRVALLGMTTSGDPNESAQIRDHRTHERAGLSAHRGVGSAAGRLSGKVRCHASFPPRAPHSNPSRPGTK